MGWTRDTIRSVAKRTGYPVLEAWSGHNMGLMGSIYGPMLHHTGTPASYAGDYPTLKVVRDGRPGLENSLAMFGIGKSGTIYLINDKISWHAGAGNWNGVTDGNGHFAGIEAEGPGTWSAAQIDSYQRLVASILLETGRDINWMPTHAQFALPTGRKTDPTGIDMNAFRGKVQQYLANPGLLGVGGVNDLTPEESTMLKQIYGFLRGGDPKVDNIYQLWSANNDFRNRLTRIEQLINAGKADNLNNFNALTTEVARLVGGIPGVQVDEDKLSEALSKLVVFTPQQIATEVADELDRRNRDGDPATGVTS